MVRKYIIFSIIATLLNIVSQYFTLLIYNGFLSIYIAILVGTLIGLISKYFLDKKFIFYYKSIDNLENFNKFISYSLTGIVTTLLFWFVEISFDLIFKVEIAKYLGAVVGLSIGYTIKYQLDKKFVFTKKNL